MSTPIRQQYLRIKQEHPDAILFFRLGDFYETFDEDAKVASRELEIVLTSKPMGKNLRVPLAGAPVHSLGQHVARLVGRGYKVAICEQLEDPGSTKGLVERGIVRVITPGTATDESMLGGSETMNLASVFPAGDAFGIAYVELSTGEFATASCRGDQLLDELGRLTPREIIQPAGEGLDLGSLNIPRYQPRVVAVRAPAGEKVARGVFQRDQPGRLWLRPSPSGDRHRRRAARLSARDTKGDSRQAHRDENL